MSKLIVIGFVLIYLPVKAQLDYSVGVNSGYRGINYLENCLTFSGSFSLSYKKVYSIIEIGGEHWSLDAPINDSWSQLKASTGSIKIAFGAKQGLGKSNFTFSAEAHLKVYFANEITNVYSLYNSIQETNGEFNIASNSREIIHSLPTPPPYNYATAQKSLYYFITEMPFSVGFKGSIGYKINQFEIRAFVMPYWVRFHYENAVDRTKQGKIDWFFYDIGLGVNYTLPFKKKEN